MTDPLLNRSGMSRMAQPAHVVCPLDFLPKSDRIVAYQLLQRGPASQGELVVRTGLSRPTVAAALNSLLNDKLAETVAGHEIAHGEGRRAHLYRLTPRVGTAIGVEIGRRHVTVVQITAGHQQILQAEEPVAASADDHPIQVLTQSAALVRRAIAEEGIEGSVLGAAVGLPVPVNTKGKIGPNTSMPAWTDINAAGELRRQLGLGAVHVGNDADLGALGEYIFGLGQGTRDLTYLKLGTGIGAGIILNGQLHVGASGAAGEIGHITVDYRGRQCRCGNRGCLERYAGGEALLEEAREAGLDIESVPDLVRKARSGDMECERIITEAANVIGAALGTLVNLNGPELIVLSGSLSAAGALLTRPLSESLNRAALPLAAQAVSIELASLDRRASAYGAAALVFERHAASQQ